MSSLRGDDFLGCWCRGDMFSVLEGTSLVIMCFATTAHTRPANGQEHASWEQKNKHMRRPQTSSLLRLRHEGATGCTSLLVLALHTPNLRSPRRWRSSYAYHTVGNRRALLYSIQMPARRITSNEQKETGSTHSETQRRYVQEYEAVQQSPETETHHDEVMIGARDTKNVRAARHHRNLCKTAY